jgi:hypothetical protein
MYYIDVINIKYSVTAGIKLFGQPEGYQYELCSAFAGVLTRIARLT